MIKKTINFVWAGPIPRWVVQNMKTWRDMNPEYRIVLCGEKQLLPRYRTIADRVTDMCSLGDLIRLSVLESSGGWYFDSDFVPLRPLAEMIRDYKVDNDFFITNQWQTGPKSFANGILGIGDGFDGWDLLHTLVDEQASFPLERTSFGPLMFGKFMDRYDRSKTKIGKWENFYWHRTRERALYAYEQVLLGHSDKVLPHTHKVYTIHLWLGGRYDQPLLKRVVEGKVV